MSSYSRLVALRDVSVEPRYWLDGISGARRDFLLEAEAASRLAVAAAHLARSASPGQDLALLVWDAYRSPVTQRAIFDCYVDELIARDGVSRADATRDATRFVSDPDTAFPHGTGGAVDLTLLVDGEPADMGTGFDSFEAKAARDWYTVHPPRCEADAAADRHRQLLREAMEAAGFVGLDSEWWHFEWGTARWARVTGYRTVLTEVLWPPTAEFPLPGLARTEPPRSL